MRTNFDTRRTVLMMALVGASTMIAGCADMKMGTASAPSTSQQVMLSGANEVPPVTSTGSAMGTVDIKPDRSVKVDITVTGITPTAAHIHEAGAGANGKVILPLNKVGDNRFVSPDNAKLTDTEYASYKAGNTYVNVHTQKNPSGELRAQLKGQ